jgi:hypothetical protein
MPRSNDVLFILSAQAVGTSVQGLGRMMGISRRTAQRWSDRGMSSFHLPQLAQLVHPHDPVLAGEIAQATGRTLEELGIVKPLPPPAPPPPPPPPPPAGLVDAVVCAAADAMNVLPRDARPGVYAAFARAAEIGTSIEFVTRVLRDALNPPAAKKKT